MIYPSIFQTKILAASNQKLLTYLCLLKQLYHFFHVWTKSVEREAFLIFRHVLSVTYSCCRTSQQ